MVGTGWVYFSKGGEKKIKISENSGVKDKTEEIATISAEVQSNAEDNLTAGVTKEATVEGEVMESVGKGSTTIVENKNAQSEFEKEEEKEAEPDFKINDRLASWGYEKASGRKIDTIILHSTYNATGGDEFDLDKIIGIYKSYGVAPHYIVARDAKVYRTVEDKNIAYHAGESKMPDGRTGVNNFSIGIEIINSKTSGPTSAQYNSLKKLLSYIKGNHSIKYTLGHSDIAPGRKDDPWKFEWGKVK